MMGFSIVLSLLLSLAPTVVAGDFWDDFSNNLATDLAPFISLLGEAPTKQFLSESITIWDYIIFAAAPLGILTILTSVIRVAGSSSLRAFIGRSQEGAGQAEAELCSSTSNDVCEMYNNGGIARVFGRPKILELVCNHNAPREEFRQGHHSANQGPGSRLLKVPAGLYTFEKYTSAGLGEKEWMRMKPRSTVRARDPVDEDGHILDENESTIFAPNPNLTLNIWMRRPNLRLLKAAAVAGILLQSSVVAIAAVITYQLGLEKESGPPPTYAFPLFAIGTSFLGIGTYLAARLIGESTSETEFRRRSCANARSEVVVLQPGGQVIGDQHFPPFAYSDMDLQSYVSSWKPSSGQIREFSQVWASLGCVMVGFVMQFIGLRALHSIIGLVNLGVTILMSAVRAGLRTRRLSSNDNLLHECSDAILGHELDWLALHLGRKSFGQTVMAGQKRQSRPTKEAQGSTKPRERKEEASCFWLTTNAMDGGRSILLPQDRQVAWDGDGKLRGGLLVQVYGSTTWPNFETKDVSSIASNSRDLNLDLELSAAEMVLNYRARLAHITGESKYQLDDEGQEWQEDLPISATDWAEEHANVRELARRLATAMEKIADIIFSSSAVFRDSWKYARSFSWAVSCLLTADRSSPDKRQRVYLSMYRESSTSPWKVDGARVEAALGLWLWSMRSDPSLKALSRYSRRKTPLADSIPRQRIVAATNPGVALWELHRPFDSILEQDPQYWERHRLCHEDGPLHLGPGRVWVPCKTCQDTDKHWRIAEDCPTDRPYANLMRLFGWQFIDDWLKRGKAWPPGICTVPTESPLPELCAQEILAAFMSNVFDLVEGGVCEAAPEHLEGDKRPKTFLSDVHGVFMAQGLGSSNEAFHCIRAALASSTSIFVGAVVNCALTLARQHFMDASRLRFKDEGVLVHAGSSSGFVRLSFPESPKSLWATLLRRATSELWEISRMDWKEIGGRESIDGRPDRVATVCEVLSAAIAKRKLDGPEGIRVSICLLRLALKASQQSAESLSADLLTATLEILHTSRWKSPGFVAFGGYMAHGVGLGMEDWVQRNEWAEDEQWEWLSVLETLCSFYPPETLCRSSESQYDPAVRQPPMELAARHGLRDALELLLRHYFLNSSNVKVDFGGLLGEAVAGNHVDTARLILAYGRSRIISFENTMGEFSNSNIKYASAKILRLLLSAAREIGLEESTVAKVCINERQQPETLEVLREVFAMLSDTTIKELNCCVYDEPLQSASFALLRLLLNFGLLSPSIERADSKRSMNLMIWRVLDDKGQDGHDFSGHGLLVATAVARGFKLSWEGDEDWRVYFEDWTVDDGDPIGKFAEDLCHALLETWSEILRACRDLGAKMEGGGASTADGVLLLEPDAIEKLAGRCDKALRKLRSTRVPSAPEEELGMRASEYGSQKVVFAGELGVYIKFDS